MTRIGPAIFKDIDAIEGQKGVSYFARNDIPEMPNKIGIGLGFSGKRAHHEKSVQEYSDNKHKLTKAAQPWSLGNKVFKEEIAGISQSKEMDEVCH